ncbi:Alcohol dehydrogenase transcription factor Myb/SANT-like family protein [Hirschfeldia incana]|nr:Alcohol dehydrogenase transcription factor Myb/SANT-like family protein [Hirschfeldia incana]
MSDPDSPPTHDPIPDQSEPASATDPKIASSKSSRRLPPPCWTLEETIALIDGYRDKWHALSRGNLKANHWEEVAEAVAAACPGVTPKKTAVQCRHKMEKLRQRYRAEIQRARSVPVARFVSSWVHYKRMEAMENKPETKPDDDDDDYQLGGGGRFFKRNGGGGGGGGGIRIRIPTGVSVAQSGPRFSGKIEPNPRTGLVGTGSNYGGSEMIMSENAMASAIKLLGDAMLRTEEKKMEMTREIEAMRMEMEMKRTKMVLESQQRIVEAFAKTMSENLEEEKMKRKKKARRMSSVE